MRGREGEGASRAREGPAKREGEGQQALERSGPAVRKLIEESGLDSGADRADRSRRPDQQGGCDRRPRTGPSPDAICPRR